MTAIPFVFSNPADSAAAWLPLDQLGLIRVIGSEARDFLQNQLTNDAKLLTSRLGQLSGYCSPKGRLLAVFSVMQLAQDDFALALPLALVAPTLKRLRMFVLRSKLTLTDASAELPALGLIGSHSAELLASQGFVVPETAYGTSQYDGICLMRRPGTLPHFELRASADRLLALRNALPLPSASASDWALTEVLAGTPQVLLETTDHFVPQTIGLDTAGGVSFSKGCYPGQEIVARVHYLGRIKQRPRLAEATALVTPGTSVHDEQGQPIGEVMAAAPHPGPSAVLSVSINVAYAGTGHLQAAASDIQITLLPTTGSLVIQ